MRRFFRVLATAVVVCALTIPRASAGPLDRDRGGTLPKIVKILKKVIKTLGDELSEPHP